MDYINSEYMPLIIFCFFPLLFICLFIIGYIFFTIKGKNAISKYCQENGLTFYKQADSILEFSNIYRLSYNGDYKYYSSIMIGKCSKIKYMIFDYSCRDRISDPKLIYTVCLLYDLSFKIPDIFIRNKKFIPIGNDVDINWIGDLEFSRQFIIDSEEKEHAKHFFNEEIKKVLVKFLKNNYDFETNKKSFIIYSRGWLELEDRIKMLNDALDIYTAMKSNK